MISKENITNILKVIDPSRGWISYRVTTSNNEIVIVPENTDNTDYQEILEWVAEGNTITDNGGGE
ncbi:hypothetical protein N9M26_01170 [Alphaproteobacteria bacterium]|nr:hypothetical protein [Alphaproteobacteria bacterium]